jgi:hypothetical protein
MTGLGETSAWGRSEAWLTRHSVSFLRWGQPPISVWPSSGQCGGGRLCAFLASAVQVVNRVAEHGLIW